MGRIPIFVGGTGLYFMALTDGLADIPAMPAGVREEARALLDEIGVEALHARLAERDPLTAAKLRPSDPQRVLRAYEVFEATGRPLAEWQERAGGAGAGQDPHRAPSCSTCRARLCAPVSPPGSRPCWSRAGWKKPAPWRVSIPRCPPPSCWACAPLQALAAGPRWGRRKRWTPPSPPRGNLPSAR